MPQAPTMPIIYIMTLRLSRVVTGRIRRSPSTRSPSVTTARSASGSAGRRCRSPAPLATPIVELVARRPHMNTAASQASPWLFPDRRRPVRLPPRHHRNAIPPPPGVAAVRLDRQRASGEYGDVARAGASGIDDGAHGRASNAPSSSTFRLPTWGCPRDRRSGSGRRSRRTVSRGRRPGQSHGSRSTGRRRARRRRRRPRRILGSSPRTPRVPQ